MLFIWSLGKKKDHIHLKNTPRSGKKITWLRIGADFSYLSKLCDAASGRCCLFIYITHDAVWKAGYCFFACRLLLTQATAPLRVDAEMFFFYLKCPLACSICAGCCIEGGDRKREEEYSSNCYPNFQIALLLSPPSSEGSFPHKRLAKQKKSAVAFAWKTNHSFTKLGNKC